MLEDIKQIRKTLTNIELEAGMKHPDKPDYYAIQMWCKHLARNVESIATQAKELEG